MKYSNETELSKYIWKLKTDNRAFDIQWSIVKRVAPLYGWVKTMQSMPRRKTIDNEGKEQTFLTPVLNDEQLSHRINSSTCDNNSFRR